MSKAKFKRVEPGDIIELDWQGQVHVGIVTSESAIRDACFCVTWMTSTIDKGDDLNYRHIHVTYDVLFYRHSMSIVGRDKAVARVVGHVED